MNTDETLDGISNPSNLPYGNVSYSAINSMGRQWIRQYTLACSKEILGLVTSLLITLKLILSVAVFPAASETVAVLVLEVEP